MPGPDLVTTVRLLIQTVRMVAARALPGVPIGVGVHTSLDFREASTRVNPLKAGKPVVIGFPYIALIGPHLSNEDERPIRIGFDLYHSKDLVAGTVVKEPFPQFKHLDFQVIIDAINLAGTQSALPLVQAFTSWAQECPRVAGLLVDLVSEMDVTGFADPGAGSEGDAVRSTGAIRLRSWRSYGGQAQVVKLVRTIGMNIYQGAAPQIAWRAEQTAVSENLNAGFALSPTAFVAVGDQGTIVRSTGDATWGIDTLAITDDLTSVWGSSANDVWAVGTNGRVLHSVIPGTWTTVDIGAGTINLTAVFGTASGRVFVCGEGGALFLFNGSTWARLSTGMTTTLRALWGVAGGGMQVIGDAGVALEVVGSAVTPIPTNTTIDFRACTGTLNGLRFYMGGEAGFVMSRNVGDAQWELVDKGVGQMMEIYAAWKTVRDGSVTVTAASTPEPVYFGGDIGRVVRMTGTVMAQLQSAQQPVTIFGLFGTNEQNLFACGEDGVMLRYSAAAGAAPKLLGTLTPGS